MRIIQAPDAVAVVNPVFRSPHTTPTPPPPLCLVLLPQYIPAPQGPVLMVTRSTRWRHPPLTIHPPEEAPVKPLLPQR